MPYFNSALSTVFLQFAASCFATRRAVACALSKPKRKEKQVRMPHMPIWDWKTAVLHTEIYGKSLEMSFLLKQWHSKNNTVNKYMCLS